MPVTVKSAFTVTKFTSLVFGDATGGAFTIALPKVSNFPGGIVVEIKKIDASANAITVSAFAGDLIEGAGTYSLSAQYKFVRLISGAPSNPSTWFLHGSN